MTLALHILRATAQRTLVAFILLDCLWVFVGVLDIARREPLLGAWSVWNLAPLFAAYGVGGCALAALAAGVAGSVAELSAAGELGAAASAGLGPGRLLRPPLWLGLALTPLLLVHEAVVFPAVRDGQYLARRALLRTPDACLRLVSADPALIPGRRLAFVPTPAGAPGSFEDVWACELAPHGLPRAVVRAASGRIGVPPARDVLRLELEDARLFTRDAGPPATLDCMHAAALTLDQPLPAPFRGKVHSPRSRVRGLTLAQLGEELATRAPGAARDLARAERSGRLARALSPLAVVLGAAALGLLAAGWGANAASLLALALVGSVLFPGIGLALRAIAAGAHGSLALLPPCALALAAWPTLRRWRHR